MGDGAGYSIERASVRQLREETGLLHAHWNEVNGDGLLDTLDPDWEAFEAAEARHELLLLFVRSNNGSDSDPGQVVGYSVSFIRPHHHATGTSMCQTDAIFMDPEHRRGGVGRDLMRATGMAARGLGAEVWYMHAKPQTALDALLPAAGFRVEETVYSRRL